MTPSVDAVRNALDRLVSDLDRSGVAYALVGGLAFSQRGEPRTTYDVDVAVAVDGDAAAERILRQLHSLGYGDHAILEDADTKRLATARLISPIAGEPVIVDLLFTFCGIEREVVSGADVLPVAGVNVAVASRASLLAMKILSQGSARRGKDQTDVLGMLDYATEAELAETRRLLGLIRERGFDRGRDLLGDLERFITIARTPDPDFRIRKLDDRE